VLTGFAIHTLVPLHVRSMCVRTAAADDCINTSCDDHAHHPHMLHTHVWSSNSVWSLLFDNDARHDQSVETQSSIANLQTGMMMPVHTLCIIQRSDAPARPTGIPVYASDEGTRTHRAQLSPPQNPSPSPEYAEETCMPITSPPRKRRRHSSAASADDDHSYGKPISEVRLTDGHTTIHQN
jgi:hypothetical protein